MFLLVHKSRIGINTVHTCTESYFQDWIYTVGIASLLIRHTHSLAASPLLGLCTSILLKILLAYFSRWWIWLTSLRHLWNSLVVSSCPVPWSTWGWYTPASKSNSCKNKYYCHNYVIGIQVLTVMTKMSTSIIHILIIQNLTYSIYCTTSYVHRSTQSSFCNHPLYIHDDI